MKKRGRDLTASLRSDSFLIDTNAVRLIFSGDENVGRRMGQVEPERIWVPSVCAEEVVSGALAAIGRARSSSGGRGGSPLTIGVAHGLFTLAMNNLRRFQILPYTDEAEQFYQTFPAKVKRVGAQDCRIAALAMTRGMTVVTRNVRDFAEIGVACEDWSRPAAPGTV